MAKILGLDLGTNSIGWAIRNTLINKNEQIEKYGVTIFEKGVGEGKSGEFSFAAERTKKRSTRRLYQSRKYKLWKTLDILIENGYCPLSSDGFNRWRKYDKEKALKGEGGRAYPIDDKTFDSWIKLDFNNDGKPDYSSPYQLRADLVEVKLDFTKETDRYKLGRALYHIAQRRGFKSSRKDVAVHDTGEKQDAKSELKKETEFENNLQKRFGKSLSDFSTIGSALAYVEKQGERVRLEWIQHTFRKHCKDECTRIFEFQSIGVESNLYKKLIESGKNRYNGAIFFQRPLRSQKGLVGKCTLETNKYRCPISHPEFETFRALSFLNNIQYRKEKNGEWINLSNDLKNEIYDKYFYRQSKAHFNFNEIREYIQKREFKDKNIAWVLDYKAKTINYSDKTNVSGCPISARLKDIFGDDWHNYEKTTALKRVNKKTGEEHSIVYNIEDIWHVLFSFDDEEMVFQFATEKLQLDEEKTKKFMIAWKACPEGYSMLSLNAIKKINVFLHKGFIYTEAVLMANIPEIIGEGIWSKEENQQLVKDSITRLITANRDEKQILNIVNNLVAAYKSLHDDEKYGFKDTTYTLTNSDKESIKQTIVETIGEKTWEEKVINKTEIIDTVNYLYQCTFRTGFETILHGDNRYHKVAFNGKTYYKSTSHQFYKLPRIVDTLKDFILVYFPKVDEKQLSKLYHPSMIETYAPSKPNKDDGKLYLQSPKTGAFKNPMAMRTLYELRKLINYLIKTGQIDEETRIVVETARDLNDANQRWAIETYQRQRQNENNEFADAIKGLLENKDYSTLPNPDSDEDIDKVRIWYEQVKNNQISKGSGEYTQNRWTNQSTDLFQKLSQAKQMVDKYRLWKEQRCICMYTGRVISISDLFNENKVDFEHTIPRSISFDNSLANLTVCFAHYNRYIKKNQIPTQLPNYENDVPIGGETYTAIKPRLKDWEDKVEHIKTMIEFWKGKSKHASTKNQKDDAIRQRHLWAMELKYWQNKLGRFTIGEVTTGFKNSQLVDTQLISKYALHYLKTAFNTVDVQKGTVTSDFRKIVEIQNIYEKKSRAKHSHHSIDALILTLIPHANQRDKILKIFYEYLEEKQIAKDTGKYQKRDWLKSELDKEVSKLELPMLETIIEEIDNNILINNIARDKALVKGKKVVRRRGKVVFLKDKQGNPLLDSDGNPKPKVAKGDCIRGELHKDTFLGAIKLPLKNEQGHYMVEQGKFIYDNTLLYVVREPLLYKKDAASPGFKSLEDLKSCIVDKHLFDIIQKQIDGRNFKDALSEGIFMYNRKGEKVNKIRHVRIFVRDKEPLKIKEQVNISQKTLINLSSRNHKRYYYAGNGENYAYALYQGIIKNKIERDFRIINLFDAASLLRVSNSRELTIESEISYNKRGDKLNLYAILKIGQKVLFFRNSPDELFELSNQNKAKRLYKITEFEKDGRIKFKYHIDARKDEEIGKGDSAIDYITPKGKLRLTKGNFNFLIEGKDFEIKPDGEIIFFN
ncbi:MAG: type II CRISPR RNA-guided endonuclease Cas9 [Bacteroidales bacterium]